MTYIPGKDITTQTLMTHTYALHTRYKLKMGNVRSVKKVIQTIFVDVCNVVACFFYIFVVFFSLYYDILIGNVECNMIVYNTLYTKCIRHLSTN